MTPDNPILVTGAHRTGTTWVGKMLAASGEAAYISEPLNILHRPGVLLTPTRYWYTYICKENEAEYLPGLRQTLSFRYHTWAEIRSLRSRKDFLRMGRDWSTFLVGKIRRQRPLLKDPFAVFSAPWFAQKLACQAVITIRHPMAFASSLKRLNWPFDFTHLLEQPLLMRDWLEPFRQDMGAIMTDPGDIVGKASLLWRMIYHAVHSLTSTNPEHGFKIVRHEDLSLNPIEGYADLYASLGLSFTPRAQKIIIKSSSAENPKEVSKTRIYSTRLDSQANLNNWKKRLSAEEIARVRSLTEDIVALYYPDLDWE